MSVVPHQPKMWAKVVYSVVCIEQRVVEIPVPHTFDPEHPEQMLEAIEAAAERLQPLVMTSDFKYEFDLQFKKPKIQVAYAAGPDGYADHQVLYRFEPLPIIYVEGPELQEISSELVEELRSDPE